MSLEALKVIDRRGPRETGDALMRDAQTTLILCSYNTLTLRYQLHRLV